MVANQLQMTSALFPKVRQRVLGLLYRFPERDFYTNEIVRATNMGTGVVLRELAKLSSAGFLTQIQIGNQKHYQANKKSPLYSELRGIVLKTFGLSDIIRESLKQLSKKIRIAFIYGSIAKQTDTADSDIDILLIGDDLNYSDFFSVMQETESQLGRKINPTFYSVDDWKKRLKSDNHFIKSVLNQPKLFLIGDESDLKL